MLSFAKTEWLRRRIRSPHGTRVAAVRGTVSAALALPRRGAGAAPRRRRRRRVRRHGPPVHAAPQRRRHHARARGTPPAPPGRRRDVHLWLRPVGVRALLASDALRGCASTPARPRPTAAPLGTLDQDQIAALFARAHVFLDMSHWQPAARRARGHGLGLRRRRAGRLRLRDAVDGVNARLVSTKDEAGAVAVLAELARDAALRARLGERGPSRPSRGTRSARRRPPRCGSSATRSTTTPTARSPSTCPAATTPSSTSRREGRRRRPAGVGR